MQSGGDLIQRRGGFFQARGLLFGALGQIVGRRGDLVARRADAGGVADDHLHGGVELGHGAVEIRTQLLVLDRQVLGDAVGQIAFRQLLERRPKTGDHQSLFLGDGRLLGRLALGLGPGLLFHDLGVRLQLGDGVLLEHQHRGGHLAELVMTIGPGDRDLVVAAGQPAHDRRQPQQRPRHLTNDHPRRDTEQAQREQRHCAHHQVGDDRGPGRRRPVLARDPDLQVDQAVDAVGDRIDRRVELLVVEGAQAGHVTCTEQLLQLIGRRVGGRQGRLRLIDQNLLLRRHVGGRVAGPVRLDRRAGVADSLQGDVRRD